MAAAPVHVAQFPWQISQVFVDVFPNFPAGQVIRQEFTSLNRIPVHVRHWLLAAPVHVAHST